MRAGVLYNARSAAHLYPLLPVAHFLPRHVDMLDLDDSDADENVAPQ